MQPRWSCRMRSFSLAVILLGLLAVPGQGAAAQTGRFPQKNAWTQATPPVVWCGDPASTTVLEVHITGRNDVRRVWLSGLGTSAQFGRAELFDDGSHGDARAGDKVFTLADAVLPCDRAKLAATGGYGTWWGYVRVELDNGTQLDDDFGMIAGLVDPEFKGAFPVHDFGNGLSATAFAFFIQDTRHEVMSGYPVADVYCGTSNYNAYRKLYSVFPDAFDFAVVTPGMQIFRPKDLAENVPYNISVANSVEHIGLPIFDDTAKFGSAGRLRAAIYNSFGSIETMDHELGHTWGINIAPSLGLEGPSPDPNTLGTWGALTDIGGQMGSLYIDQAGNRGHFVFTGEGTWRLRPMSEPEPYSQLELYLMGLIPPERVQPVHILQDPDLGDLSRVTAASYRTVTIEQITAAAGGPRIPSAAEAQKDFKLAFIVTQDLSYNDAAYAFFSLMSHALTSQAEPALGTYFVPFYWGTGGLGTLDTRLPVDLAAPDYLPGDPTPTPLPTQPMPTEAGPVQNATLAPSGGSNPGRPPVCGSALLAGGLVLVPGAMRMARRRKGRS